MSKRRQDLMVVINQFYAQPVARVSFELVITVVVVLFFALFAIRPTLLTMADLIKEINDKKALDQALDQKVAALSTGQSQYLTLQNRLVTLDAALPNNPELLIDLKILEKIASDRHIAITNIGIPEIPNLATDVPATSAATLTRQNLAFSLTVSADYLTIRQFIADLQQSQRVIVVDNVSFSQSNGSESGLEAQISLNLPYFGTATGDKP